MADLRIPRWLQTSPPAFKARVWLADGSERIVAIDQKDPRRWSRARDAILGLGALRVEALSKEGDVLRTLTIEDEEQQEKREALDKERRQRELESTSREIQFARLLNEAADASAKRHEAFVSTAFNMCSTMAKSVLDAHNKNVALINALLRRLAMASQPEAEGGGVPDMLQAIVMGRMGMPMPGAGPRANGVPHVPVDGAGVAAGDDVEGEEPE